MAATAATLDVEVQRLLAAHEHLEAVDAGEGRVRVRCALTQHEMVPRADAIEAYLGSKKFMKARDWYCHDYSQYEPYIVAHRRKPKSLFCNVTGTVLNRIPAEVERHVNGKKFQRLKAQVTIKKVEDEELEGGGFDANAFEFENSQVLWSDDEGEEGGEGKVSKDVDVEEEGKEEEEEEEQDDMSDLYPEDDGSEDEHVHAAVQAALAGENDDPMGEVREKKPKKEKVAASNKKKRAPRDKPVKKRRQQKKRQKTSGQDE